MAIPQANLKPSFAREREQSRRLGKRSPSARPRVAIVVSHPIQHFCPMYRKIAEDGRVELLVIFAVAGSGPRFDKDFRRKIAWQSNLMEGFPSSVLNTTARDRTKAVLKALSDFNPDVVYVHGYADSFLRAAMRWSKRAGVGVLMTTDSELRHPRPFYARALKRLLLPNLLNKVDLFLTVGDENERYFSHYGVTPNRFHRVPFSIDSDAFASVLQNREEVSRKLREDLSIPVDARILLTVGKLIPRNGHACLIKALEQLPKTIRGSFVLLIAGEGIERPQLERAAQPLGKTVRLLGFIGVEELPKYYVTADIYVHPSSHDPHPLAISEALFCGLPVIASDRIGSIGPSDDVQLGKNGWVFPNDDSTQLSDALREILEHPELLQRASSVSRELGKTHSSENCASRFIEGVLRVLA